MTDHDFSYYGLDGDSIGRTLETYFISNDIEKLKTFSNKVNEVLNKIKEDVIAKQGDVILCGGDSILFSGEFSMNYIEEVLSLFKKTTGKTASIGVGKNIFQTYVALKLAKSLGGNRIMVFEEIIQHKI